MFRLLFGYAAPFGTLLSRVFAVLTWLGITPDYLGIRPSLEHIVGIAAPASTPSGNSFNSLFDQGRQAARHHRWNEAVGYYERALATDGLNGERRVELLDAAGYALMRDGQFDKAAATIDQALAIQPAAAVPRVNKIKIMCGRGERAERVTGALAALRADLSSGASRHRYVESDGELFTMCAYAGVEPAP